MLTIHTILAHGECLMPEVLEGVLKQTVECCLMPITSERDWKFHRRKNMIANWREAYHYYDGEVFIGFDSDVVLSNPKAVETLLERIKDNDMVTIATKTNHRKVFHSLFAVKKGSFLEFSDNYDSCPICIAVETARKKGKKIECISNKEIHVGECARFYVRRKKLCH